MTTVTNQLRILACIEALTELVRLKDMKEKIEHPGPMDAREFARMLREYNEKKEPAWDAARAALAQETPVKDLGVWGKLGQAVRADQCPHAAVPSSCQEVQCFMTKTCRMRGTL